MAMRCLLVFMIAFAVSALHGQAMFEGATGFGEEELKGRPKIVTVEREKLGQKAVRLPEEEFAYREDGKLSSHRRFVDGKLIANEIWEYDSKGDRTAIITHDVKDEVIRVQRFLRSADQLEEEIDTAGGKEQSRTTRRFDAKQRVVELRNTDTDKVSTIMNFDYDDRGRPIRARMRLEGENVFAIERGPDGVHRASSKPSNGQVLRLEITYPGENQAIITVYDLAGKIILQLQTTEDGAGNEMGQILFEQEPQGKPANSAKVESMDAHGNWVLKTLLERNPRTQVDEPVARLHRSIVYY